jgi:serine/threonine-protein kinase
MLQSILSKKPLGQIPTLRLAKQILVLMRHLHDPRRTKKGRPFYYLFCDLKADNIIVTDGEQVSLIDLGAVKIHWMDQQEIEVPIFVTDGYAAPEVYSGSIELKDNPRVDKQFDIFTMGALMVHCVTGRHPSEFFTSYTPPQHDFGLQNYPEIARPLKDVIHRATAPERKDRYADADEMLKDIWRALEELK